MTAEAAALVRSYRVGRYTCTWTLRRPVRGAVVHSTCEWSPHLPRSLTAGELREYRKGRAAVFDELARVTGLRTLVVEA